MAGKVSTQPDGARRRDSHFLITYEENRPLLFSAVVVASCFERSCADTALGQQFSYSLRGSNRPVSFNTLLHRTDQCHTLDSGQGQV